jgi:hypothetical protein
LLIDELFAHQLLIASLLSVAAAEETKMGTVTINVAISVNLPHSPSSESGRKPTGAEPPSSKALKFSNKRLAVAFAIAGLSDAIGAFATMAPPIVWVVDVGTALLLFMVLGRQWLLLPGLVLEAIPGVGALPFWLLVVGAIAVLGTPRPKFEQHR